MNSDDIKGIAQTYFDAWRSQGFDRLESILADDISSGPARCHRRGDATIAGLRGMADEDYAVTPAYDTAAALGIIPGSAVLVARTRHYSGDGKLIEYAETTIPAGHHYSRTYVITPATDQPMLRGVHLEMPGATLGRPRLLACSGNERLRHVHLVAGMLTVAAPSSSGGTPAAVTDSGGGATYGAQACADPRGCLSAGWLPGVAADLLI